MNSTTTLPHGTDSMDEEITNLRIQMMKDPDAGFISLIDAMIRHSEAKEYFKLKEFFIETCEGTKKLPPMTDYQADRLIEALLLVCQKHPSPLATRGFESIFFRLLKNPENYETNTIFFNRFRLTRQSIQRIGLESYFGIDEKESLDEAINNSLFLLMENEYSSPLLFFDVAMNPKVRDLLTWSDMRNKNRSIKYLYEQFATLLSNQESKDKIDSIKYEEQKLLILELKESLRETKEELAALKRKTATAEELEKSKLDCYLSLTYQRHISEKIDDALAKVNRQVITASQEINQNNEKVLRALETVWARQFMAHSVTSEKIKNLEIVMANLIQEFSGQTEESKKLTANNIVQQAEFISEIKTRVLTMEQEFQRNDESLKDMKKNFTNFVALYEMNVGQNMEEMKKTKESINQTRQEIENYARDMQRLSESLSSYQSISDIRSKLARLNDVLMAEVATHLNQHRTELDEVKKSIVGVMGRIDGVINDQSNLSHELAKTGLFISKIQTETANSVKEIAQKCSFLEEDYARKLEKSNNKIIEYIQNQFNQMTIDFSNFKQVSERLKDLVENVLVKENDILSTKISQLTVNGSVLQDRIAQTEATINNCNRHIATLETRVMELCQVIGVNFDSTNEFEIQFRNQISKLPDKSIAKEVIKPFLSTFYAESKAIVNKLPVLQKKIKILAKCIKQLDDTNRTSVNEVSDDEFNVITVDDVNQNLQIVKSQLINEIKGKISRKSFLTEIETHNSILQTIKILNDSNKENIERTNKIEKQYKDATFGQILKTDVEEKLKETLAANQKEMSRYQESNTKLFNEKFHSIEAEIINLKKGTSTPLPPNTREASYSNSAKKASTSTNDNSFDQSFSATNTLKRSEDVFKLNLLESAQKTYIEDKVNNARTILFRNDVVIEDRLAAFLSIVGYYRFINHKFFTVCFNQFRDLAIEPSNSSALDKARRSMYPNVHLLLENSFDTLFPNFPLMLNTLIISLSEACVPYYLKRGCLSNIINGIARVEKPDIQVLFMKLLGNLLKYDSLLEYAAEKKYLNQIYDNIMHILQTVMYGKTLNPSTEKDGLPVITEELHTEHNWSEKIFGGRIVESLNTLITFLTSPVADYGHQGKKPLSTYYEELVYFSFYCLFYCLKRTDFITDNNCSPIIKYSLMLLEKNYPIKVIEIGMLAFLRLTERTVVTQHEIENIYQLEHLIKFAAECEAPKLQSYIIMTLKNLGKDEGLINYLSKNPEYNNLMKYTIHIPQGEKVPLPTRVKLTNLSPRDNYGKLHSPIRSESFNRSQSQQDEPNDDSIIADEDNYRGSATLDIRNNRRLTSDSKSMVSKSQIEVPFRHKQRNLSVGRERNYANEPYDPLKVDPTYKSKLKTTTKLQLPNLPTGKKHL